MAYCCVPYCKSDQKKTPGVSFHEIPCKSPLREQWIKAISRSNWTPNSTSNYSRICSRHFLESDFLQGLKVKRLKPGTVPTVFEEYPSYMQPKKKKPRLCNSIGKRMAYNSNNSASNCAAGVNLNNRENVHNDTMKDFIEVHKTCSQSVQVDLRLPVSEKEKWIRKLNIKNKHLQSMQKQLDTLKRQVKELENNKDVKLFLKIVECAKENETPAVFIMDQIRNYFKKRPVWSETTLRYSIVLRNLSTKSYEHIRKVILKLPSRNTLTKFLGGTSGDIGFSPLVEKRLIVELSSIKTHQGKICSLVIDEMKIKQKLQYHKQRDAFIGEVNLGNTNIISMTANQTAVCEPTLANSLLCFLLNGLSINYKIPAAYYFTKGLTGAQLAELILLVLKQVKTVGFEVVRVVTDNLKVNTVAMKIICGGNIKHEISHPYDPNKKLFLSFDPVHVQKNWRSQFLSRDIGQNNEISSKYVKKMYELQKNSLLKPVRFLTRKHVFPNNIEKMNVKRSVQLFSHPVTAALKFLRDQAGHTAPSMFASASSTIEYMEICFKWFLLHDVSDWSQHSIQKLPDSRPFDSADDERLVWLTTTFFSYLEDLKSKSTVFLTDETYEAIRFTSCSTAACVKYLLTECMFQFVLTRKFSSDSIEAFFGFMRRSAGCNDQLDAKAVISSLEKILKTGNIISSENSNILDNKENNMTSSISCNLNVQVNKQDDFPLSDEMRNLLSDLEKVSRNENFSKMPTSQYASLSHMAGYIVRVAIENVTCDSCISNIIKPNTNQPIQGLTKYLDRGGLYYAADHLIEILRILEKLLKASLKCAPKNWKPLSTLLDLAVPSLQECPALKCTVHNETKEHVKNLCVLICKKFISPLLSNYANMINDKYDSFKNFKSKPQ